MSFPDRSEVVRRAAEAMYGRRILNNAHRGDVVEAMVKMALGDAWRFVGLGWHPWDFQRGSGPDRVRIQVKQTAALQLWGATKRPSLRFGWSKEAPTEFERYNPDEQIEPEGWFCELFVFGVHLEADEGVADHADPRQWQFLVVPASDLQRGQQSMVLHRALDLWAPVRWTELSEAVEKAVRRLEGAR